MNDDGAEARRPRAPLLWLVLPLATGLFAIHPVADRLPAPVWALIGVIGAGLAVAASLKSTGIGSWIAALSLWGAGIGGAALVMTAPSAPTRAALPPREANLVVQWTRLFAGGGNADRASGIAIIRDAPLHLGDITGTRIAVSASGYGVAGQPLPGAVETIRGVLQPLPQNPEPGSFDAHLYRQGIRFRLSRGRMETTLIPPPRWRTTIAGLAHKIEGILLSNSGHRPRESGLLAAMVLGRRDFLSPTDRERFVGTGTFHLFAISGLHVGVVMLTLQTTLGLARMPRTAATMGGILLAWVYVQVTGAPPSAVRAFLMAACVAAALIPRRPFHPAAGLAASALAVLIVAPRELFGPGFQMSYGVVSAIVLLGIPLARRWQETTRPWKAVPEPSLGKIRRRIRTIAAWATGSAAICVAAGLVALFTGVTFFGVFTPGAIVANLALVPLASLAVIAGFLAGLAGLVGIDGWVALFQNAGWIVVGSMTTVVEWAEFWKPLFPAAEWRWNGWGSASLVLILGGLLAGAARGWRRPLSPWTPFAAAAVLLAIGLRIY